MKLRGQLYDAPAMKLVGEATADGSDAHRPAACAGSLVAVCTEMGVDTSVGKRKIPRGMKKKPFHCHRAVFTWSCGTKNKETHSILYSLSVVVVVVMSASLLCWRPRAVWSGLLRAAEAASCYVAWDLRPRWLSPPPLRWVAGGAGVIVLYSTAVEAAVVSTATDAAGGSSPGGELAPAAEAGAGGADDVASAGIEEPSRAAALRSTSTTRTSVTGLVLAGFGGAGGAKFSSGRHLPSTSASQLGDTWPPPGCCALQESQRSTAQCALAASPSAFPQPL